MLALVLGMVGQHEEALSAAKLAVDREPNSFLTWRNLGLVFRWNKECGDAISAFERALNISAGNHWDLAEMATTYAVSGRTQEAEAIFSDLKERLRERHVEYSWLRMLLGALDKMDEAYQCAY